MAFHGERFAVDLDSDPEDQPQPSTSTLNIPGVIGDIQERSPAAPPGPPGPPGPPAPPTLKSGSSGFPLHRRRAKQSAFKERQTQSLKSATKPERPSSGIQDERTVIQEQNRQQLAAMSDTQIQHERDELISSLDPSLLERFLRRARIDDDENGPSSNAPEKDDDQPRAYAPKPGPTPAPVSLKSKAFPYSRDEVPPSIIPEDLHPAANLPHVGSVHFPTPPPRATPMPTLDPSSPDFLSNLQSHYFPNISHEPSTLSWLQPPSSEPDEPGAPPSSAYHPGSSAEAVHPASLRFSLVGTVLSPSTSLSLPTTLGLHHHGNDPQAAGYTIPELAILSRSTFPAQRCIAWQVLGRILFRLGKGQFGERGSTLVEGLWFVIEREGVVVGMLEEAGSSTSSPSCSSRRAAKDPSSAEGDEEDSLDGNTSSVRRHASASAWAVEGVWLWQMSGAGDRGVLKPGTIRSQ
ncbi:RPAP1-like protein [Aspergillus crustosus]